MCKNGSFSVVSIGPITPRHVRSFLSYFPADFLTTPNTVEVCVSVASGHIHSIRGVRMGCGFFAIYVFAPMLRGLVMCLLYAASVCAVSEILYVGTSLRNRLWMRSRFLMLRIMVFFWLVGRNPRASYAMPDIIPNLKLKIAPFTTKRVR